MSGELGRLVLQFAADVAGFQSDLGRVERAAEKSARETAKAFDKAMDGVKTSIKGAALSIVAAFSIDAFRDFINGAIDAGDAIQDLSDKVGISVKSLSELKFVSEQNGGSVDTLASAIKKLSKAQTDALGGNEKLGAIFSELGVGIDDLQSKNADEVFVKIADGFSKIEDAALRVAVAQKLFGKSGTELIPLLSQGSEAIENQRGEFERLFGVVNESTTQGFAQFNDQLASLSTAAEGLGTQIGAALLPALQAAAESLTEFLVQAREEGSLQRFAENASDIARGLISLAEIIGKSILLVSDLTDGIDNLAKATLVAIPGVGAALAAYSRLANIEPPKQAGGVGRPFPENQESTSALIKLYQIGAKVADEFRLRLALAGKTGAEVGDTFKKSAPKAREFVEAVRVLSIDKSIVGTPKELAAAVRRIREELNPTIRITREYNEAVKTLTASTEADSNQRERNERTLAKLKIQYDKDIAAAQDLTGAQESVTDSLKRQIEALKGNVFGHEETARAIRIEEEYQRQLNAAVQQGAVINDEYRESLRKQVEELDDLKNRKPFDLGTAIAESINEGFTKASVGAGFKSFFEKVRKAFSGSAEQVAESIASVANTLSEFIVAAEGSDGNSTGAALRAINSAVARSNIPYASAYAAAAEAVDTLFGGKLFGTDYTRQSQVSRATFGAGGFDANTTTVDTRQRSFFRGRQTRTTNAPAEISVLEAGAEFQAALDDISRTIADAFNTDIGARVEASFIQNFDEDGLVSTIATVGGRAVSAGTQQAFEQFLTAQTILDALGPSIEGLDALADPFRETGKGLADFARFALSAQTDISRGAALLGEGSSFAELIPIISELSSTGEGLVETYQRVFESVGLLDEALSTIAATTNLTRAEFVNFSAELVEGLGGIRAASEIIGRNLAEFFSPDQLRANRLSTARTTLAGLGEASGLGVLSSEAFRGVLTQALAGAFDADRTAEILAYGDALATVNALVRETTAANEAAAAAEIERAQAIKDAAQSLGDFVSSLQDQASNGSLTNYQRTIKALNQQYAENATSLLELARAAGLTAAPIEGVTANLSILAQGAARALADLKVSVLQGLDALFGSQQTSTADAFNAIITGNIVATQNWAEQLRELETLQSTQDLARNIADLFDASGLSFAAGVEQYGVPLRALLDNLGVDFANLTSTASIDAFGAAASLLGVSADELASIAGIDLSALTDAQVAALDLASAPQIEASESSASSLLSIDDKTSNMIALLMQQNTNVAEQSDALVRLSANLGSLSDEVRRLANRVPAA